MGKPNLKLADETPPRTPEREQLAEAINQLAMAERTLAANKAAQEQTRKARWAAQDAVEASATLIEEAQANAAKFLTEQALGTAAEAPVSIKAVRVAAQDAQDELDAAIAASAALVEQEAAAKYELQYAANEVDKCIRDVIKAETRAMVSELLRQAEGVQADLISRRVVLRHLHRAEIIGEPEATAVKTFLRHNGDVLPGAFGSVEFHDYDKHPAAEPWREAQKMLATDADAPLPA
jgi:hypothetical protein